MPFLLLMPSFNQAQYIGEAVRSILAQDDADWELWIVDNSTDETPRIMAEFSDPRIRFHHIPRRMDPGTCLNWMLERAQGRDFSYVHTDNNLAPGYVRAMRAALADDPMSLAYCDMRVIDEHGVRTQVSRRGPFGLARLLSLRPLGVPFAATTELARKLGGFSTDDVADDVRFCALAWGMARFVYLREPLLDYRLHRGSRTEGAGGQSKIERTMLRTHARVLPALAARNLRPVEALATEIEALLLDLDLTIEDAWYRYLARNGARWCGGPIGLEAFFRAGLIRFPCEHDGRRQWFGADRAQPAFRGRPTSWFHVLRLQVKLRRELALRGSQLRDLLVPWAYLARGAPDEPITFGTASDDARTQWGARLLQGNLGWRLADTGAPPGAPVLDLRQRPRLEA